jgi:ABC-type multidrug transport system ATPase subunit
MLSIQQLTHVYPNGTRALDGVTLEIPRGMFGLLGPNGAGKSSLMRCLATLQIPSSGSMRFGDIDIRTQPAALRETLGYLPQDFGVYPRVSALAMLDHLAVLKGVARRGERRETVDALLQQVNLWDVRRRAIAGFSGGMRQRFGIAQALIGNPQLIIVDEPTAGLDPEERNRFNNLLAEVGESRVVILSTHIVDDVTDLCSRMAILVAGRIVAHDTPRADRRARRPRLQPRGRQVGAARAAQAVRDHLDAPERRAHADPRAVRRAARSALRAGGRRPGGRVLRDAEPRARGDRRFTRGHRSLKRAPCHAETHRRL